MFLLQLGKRLTAVVGSRSSGAFPVVGDGVADEDDVYLAAGRRDLGQFLGMALLPPAGIRIPAALHPDAAFRRRRRISSLEVKPREHPDELTVRLGLFVDESVVRILSVDVDAERRLVHPHEPVVSHDVRTRHEKARERLGDQGPFPLRRCPLARPVFAREPGVQAHDRPLRDEERLLRDGMVLVEHFGERPSPSFFQQLARLPVPVRIAVERHDVAITAGHLPDDLVRPAETGEAAAENQVVRIVFPHCVHACREVAIGYECKKLGLRRFKRLVRRTRRTERIQRPARAVLRRKRRHRVEHAFRAVTFLHAGISPPGQLVVEKIPDQRPVVLQGAAPRGRPRLAPRHKPGGEHVGEIRAGAAAGLDRQVRIVIPVGSVHALAEIKRHRVRQSAMEQRVVGNARQRVESPLLQTVDRLDSPRLLGCVVRLVPL